MHAKRCSPTELYTLPHIYALVNLSIKIYKAICLVNYKNFMPLEK